MEEISEGYAREAKTNPRWMNILFISWYLLPTQAQQIESDV